MTVSAKSVSGLGPLEPACEWRADDLADRYV
ncbi:MAG: hypothetical protein QOG23_5763, partial [Blastocatellia bacterium]|nr:hypothetical protein [Blastocatellia bacterium]